MSFSTTTSTDKGTEKFWADLVQVHDSLFVCMVCGMRNAHWEHTCEKCDYLESVAVDEVKDE